MEANKENVWKIKTKIPLPLEPLPALPKHLLSRNVEKCTNEKRPLKTLAQVNVLPSSSYFRQENPLPKTWKVKVDTKYVTMRNKTEDLDWDYKVLKDDESLISISDNESEDKNVKEDTFFGENKHRNCLDERLAITPSDKSLLHHKSLRNIKKSLKRPHSRELQGLSPVCELEKREEDKVKRRLQFYESKKECLQTPDSMRPHMTYINRDYTDYMLGYLLKIETKPLAVPKVHTITRACVINWLMKVNGPSGNPAVIQSACWYLDSVLSKDNVQLDNLQLVAAACYWIAQKIHGPAVRAASLVKYANNAFTQGRLLSAEKAVMLKLGFPLQPVTPYEYITYLAWLCDSAHPEEIEVAATFLSISGLMVRKELCEEYPSVIAAAAVRNAVILLRKKHLTKRLYDSPMYIAALKKASNLSRTCAILRKAVRTIADCKYEYKAPLEHYGVPPHYIAHQIINATRQDSSSRKMQSEDCL